MPLMHEAIWSMDAYAFMIPRGGSLPVGDVTLEHYTQGSLTVFSLEEDPGISTDAETLHFRDESESVAFAFAQGPVTRSIELLLFARDSQTRVVQREYIGSALWALPCRSKHVILDIVIPNATLAYPGDDLGLPGLRDKLATRRLRAMNIMNRVLQGHSQQPIFEKSCVGGGKLVWKRQDIGRPGDDTLYGATAWRR